MGYFYIFGTIFCTVYGQLIIKWRITDYGDMPEIFFDKILFLLRVFFDPYVLSGFISAFIASFFWMAAMTKFDLSFAYPIIIAGLVLLTTLFGIILLNESISMGKIAGPLLILSGVIVLFSWE